MWLRLPVCPFDLGMLVFYAQNRADAATATKNKEEYRYDIRFPIRPLRRPAGRYLFPRPRGAFPPAFPGGTGDHRLEHRLQAGCAGALPGRESPRGHPPVPRQPPRGKAGEMPCVVLRPRRDVRGDPEGQRQPGKQGLPGGAFRTISQTGGMRNGGPAPRFGPALPLVRRPGGGRPEGVRQPLCRIFSSIFAALLFRGTISSSSAGRWRSRMS